MLLLASRAAKRTAEEARLCEDNESVALCYGVLGIALISDDYYEQAGLFSDVSCSDCYSACQIYWEGGTDDGRTFPTRITGRKDYS